MSSNTSAAQALGGAVGNLYATLTDLAEGFSEGFKRAREAEEKRRKEIDAYFKTDEGQLEMLRHSCPSTLDGLVQYSNLVADFYTKKLTRELDELEQRLNGDNDE